MVTLINRILKYVGNRKAINREIDIIYLPSRGLFYPSNIEIKIRQANLDHQIYFLRIISGTKKTNYDNIFRRFFLMIEILKDCVVINNDMTIEDLCATDIPYIFLELIKYTLGDNSNILVTNDNIYLADISDIMKYYDTDKRRFVYNGWSASLINVRRQRQIYSIYNDEFIIKNIDILKDADGIYTYFLADVDIITKDILTDIVLLFSELSIEEKKAITSISDSLRPLNNIKIHQNGGVYDVDVYSSLDDIWKIN